MFGGNAHITVDVVGQHVQHLGHRRAVRDPFDGPADQIGATRVLQTFVDAENATRLLLARELTLEEKREFVDLRIEGWLRSLHDSLSAPLRREWSSLRELAKDALTLDAIQRLVALEHLRGNLGA